MAFSAQRSEADVEIGGTLPEVVLEVRQGAEALARHPMPNSCFLIGTIPGCDLQLRDTRLPLLICLLERSPAGVGLRLLSSAPLHLNDGPATTTDLKNDDRLKLGNVTITVRVSAAATAPSTSAAAPEAALRMAQYRQELQQNVSKAHERAESLRRLEEQAAQSRTHDQRERLELGKRAAEVARLVKELEEERRAFQLDKHAFEEEQQHGQDELSLERAAVQQQQQDLTAAQAECAAQVQQYEASLRALDKRTRELDQREHGVQLQAEETAQQKAILEREGADLQEQVFQLDEYRSRLLEEAQRLTKQKAEQDATQGRLLEQGAELENQQQALAALQSQLFREQEELRARQHDLEAERARQTAQELLFAQQEEDLVRREAAAAALERSSTEERQEVAQQQALLDSAQQQMRQIQEQLAVDQQRLSRQAEELEPRSRRLAEGQRQLEADRQALRERSIAVAQKEQAFAALEADLQRRAAELAAQHDALALEVPEHEARATALQTREAEIERQERTLRQELETLRFELQAWADALELRSTELAEAAAQQRAQEENLVQQRRELAEERKRCQQEQQLLLEQQAQARADLERLRREAQDAPRQLPPAAAPSPPRERAGTLQPQLRALVTPAPLAAKMASAEQEPASAPTILRMDQGDRRDAQLVELMQERLLIDEQTVATLTTEARKQRRPLRQLLLDQGLITPYQFSLVDAGTSDKLALGPIWALDLLRTTPHETIYHAMDSRRGGEVLLRHLAEPMLRDSARVASYRQCFTKAILAEPHLAQTLEVLEIDGRPAVVQEWLAGLPATDWTQQAATPGVCHRLLTHAAQGLAAAHRAGLAHGQLSDVLLFLTVEGELKVCGIGEPIWLHSDNAQEPDPRADLKALGCIASAWCGVTGPRRRARVKPLPAALASLLERLSAGGYADAGELLQDLAGADMPPSSDAWDRLLKYVRAQVGAETVGSAQAA
jgi:hypothetical protein